MKHLFENHDFVTERGAQLIDLTEDVRSLVDRSEIDHGMALVYAPHTTCAIVINEKESGFEEDFADLLATIAPAEDTYYRHDDLSIRTEGLDPDGPEPANGHAHCLAGILASSSQTVPIVDGALMLGRWQRIFLCELDSSRPRKVFIQVIGE